MISIGILSYNSPITLKNTLLSYKHYGLLDLSDDIFCVIQPSDKVTQEISVCDEFRVKYYVETNNEMMLGGMKRVFKESKYEFVLWTENDFRIHTSKDKVYEIINYSIKLIKDETVDLVRIRSLKLPGHPITTKHKYNNEMNELSKLDYACYYTESPEIKFSEFIKKHSDKPRILIMDSKYCSYTNNCFITTKKFFNNVILKHSQGNPHIEPDIDKVWSELNMKIGISDGFLTHVRLDGHTNCWCCHKDFGGIDNSPKCSCCVNDYIKNIEFITNKSGEDISQFQTGNEWLEV